MAGHCGRGRRCVRGFRGVARKLPIARRSRGFERVPGAGEQSTGPLRRRAIVTPFCRREAMVALGRFPRAFAFLSLVGHGGTASDASPALRPARGGAGRQPGRGGATGCEGQVAVRLPGAQPGSADEPGRTAYGRLRGGGLAGPASEPERPALEAAPRHRSGAPSRTIGDRARAAA
jgi:hypothetical protein